MRLSPFAVANNLTMFIMCHLKIYLLVSAIFMVAYTRTTTEFRPTAGGGCGTVAPIQVLVNPTQVEIDKSIAAGKCMYIKTETSSFTIAPNSTVNNSTAPTYVMDALGFWGY